MVIPRGGPNLLGRNWLSKTQFELKDIFKLESTDPVQEVLHKHQEVFSEGLGKLK